MSGHDAGPATPYLRVDVARVRRNITTAAERAAAAGVALRPHAKTHKSPDIARLQLEAGAIGLTVATIGEAEVFVDHGVEDVFIAYPLWLSDQAARRVRDLAERADLAIGIDSVASARRAGRLLTGTGTAVLVEVDSGQHRTGAAPAEAGQVAAAAAEAGLPVRGVFTFPGHGYSPDAKASAAADEAAALAVAVASFRDAGLEPDVVSGGSTPTLAHTHTDAITEVRPGVYLFGDAQQWELDVVSPESIALTCRATVVSHAGGHLVLDSGSKALGADRAPYATGWGRLLDHPEARVVQLSEHHAVVDLGGTPLPELGSQVDVVPNHVCAAVNLADTLWADDGSALVPWPVAARGRNS
ncbi:alanine racemase [Nocardioides sp. Root1257]|uniref:alanine racemase n=1 Tax=unclassified Nocardioides TaxID=2615069 RepID=UPI0006F67C7F|nr:MULTISPECIES: alanine racemase [unclassified Nocardioides]KQW52955.1 alanine racemase [Nocardioides sp. Root1257]KRC55643.1 alanine racemase [Nocardioides sp. Root224]